MVCTPLAKPLGISKNAEWAQSLPERDTAKARPSIKILIAFADVGHTLPLPSAWISTNHVPVDETGPPISSDEAILGADVGVDVGVEVGVGVGAIIDADVESVADADVEAEAKAEVAVVFNGSETGSGICVAHPAVSTAAVNNKTSIPHAICFIVYCYILNVSSEGYNYPSHFLLVHSAAAVCSA